jgi:hypothetical protein
MPYAPAGCARSALDRTGFPPENAGQASPLLPTKKSLKGESSFIGLILTLHVNPF